MPLSGLSLCQLTAHLLGAHPQLPLPFAPPSRLDINTPSPRSPTATGRNITRCGEPSGTKSLNITSSTSSRRQASKQAPRQEPRATCLVDCPLLLQQRPLPSSRLIDWTALSSPPESITALPNCNGAHPAANPVRVHSSHPTRPFNPPTTSLTLDQRQQVDRTHLSPWPRSSRALIHTIKTVPGSRRNSSMSRS